jgi:TonB family protein
VNLPSRTLLALKPIVPVALAIISISAVIYAQEPARQTPSLSDQAPSPPPNGMQILTPTEGVNFSSYMQLVHNRVNRNWTTSLPEAFYKGEKGEAVIQFDINQDGKITNILLERSSGNDSLDQAVVNAIRNSDPLTSLPPTFKGPYIRVRGSFFYNQSEPTYDCIPSTTENPRPPFDRLELLAFLAGQIGSAYEARAVCERGIDFTPEYSFLAALRTYGAPSDLVISLAHTKPRSITQPTPERLSAYDLLDAALTEKRDKKLASANEDFARALQLAPDSATLHLAYARNLLLVQNYSEAEAQARQSLKLWPEDAEAHLALAWSLSGQNRDTEAVSEAREALRIFPSDMAGRVQLALALARSEQFKDAIPALQQALSSAPEVPSIHKFLGISLLHTGDYDGAIGQLSLYLRALPNDAQAHYFLGVALRETGKRDQALAEFREAARIEPNSPLYAAALDRENSEQYPRASPKPIGPGPDDCFFSDNVYTNTFFGFSYEFPKGWMVMKPGTGEALARFGTSLLAGGDPTVPDISEAAVRITYQLLVVTKQSTKDVSAGVSSIHIQAMDKRVLEPNLSSGEVFLNSMIALSKHRDWPVSVLGPPEQLTIGGRTVWKVRLDPKINGATTHVVEAVMIEKDYLLLFVFSSPDVSKLDELVHTMQSIHFTDSQ